MSFGFSVGDIILVSQLAYKLYLTVTSGRRAAGKDLRELEDVLFGLRCALDHLAKATEDISATASSRQDVNAIEMRRKLGAMVASCGVTLQELESVTKKYREVADPAESDVVHEQPRSVARLKEDIRVNWRKIRWDVERYSLSEYREKLQAHTDAINVVLSTFLWSATHRIEADGKIHAEKMQELQNQALQSNKLLLQLVQEVHNMLLASKVSPSLPPAASQKPLPHYPETEQNGGITSTIDSATALHHGNNHLTSPYQQPLALMAGSPFLASTDNAPTPPARRLLQRNLASNFTVAAHYGSPTPKLQEENPAIGPPATIAQLNERRQLTGSMEFKQYREKYHSQKPPPKPSFLTLEIPTLVQLRDGLTYVFRPFSQTVASRPAAVNRDDRKREISLWTQGLDHLLDSWMSSEPMASDLKEPARPTADQNEMMVDFLICLNRSVEKSDDRMKRLFYQSTEHAGIHGVLDKLQAVSKSVRVMKEIEEFEDVKEEWKDG